MRQSVKNSLSEAAFYTIFSGMVMEGALELASKQQSGFSSVFALIGLFGAAAAGLSAGRAIQQHQADRLPILRP
jgi:hypothetical protein